MVFFQIKLIFFSQKCNHRTLILFFFQMLHALLWTYTLKNAYLGIEYYVVKTNIIIEKYLFKMKESNSLTFENFLFYQIVVLIPFRFVNPKSERIYKYVIVDWFIPEYSLMHYVFIKNTTYVEWYLYLKFWWLFYHIAGEKWLWIFLRKWPFNSIKV